MKSNFIEYNASRETGTNQFIKARREGKEVFVSNETKLKLSKRFKGKKLSKNHKKAISEGMKKAVKNNPESYSSKNVYGRNKRFNLLKDGEEIILHSSW